MGRTAGVAPEETRARLLDAAARVFARRGYDGAGVAELSSEAGLSTGAIYATFGSKAGLFAATLHAFTGREIDRLVGADDTDDIASLIAAHGARLDRRSAAEGSLLVEAIVVAGRDPEVAAVLRSEFEERQASMAGLVRRAQAGGSVDPAASAEAAAHLALMLALGSRMVAALELDGPPHDEWAALIAGIVDSFRTEPTQANTTEEA